jgi:hypothetical protein
MWQNLAAVAYVELFGISDLNNSAGMTCNMGNLPNLYASSDSMNSLVAMDE